MTERPLCNHDGVNEELLPGAPKRSSADIGDAEESSYERSKSVPIAWISFAENGNIRLWTSDEGRAKDEKARGLDMRAFTLAELVALISRIPAQPQEAPQIVTAARSVVKAFNTPNSDRVYGAMKELEAALSLSRPNREPGK